MARSDPEDRAPLDAVIAARTAELLETSGVIGVGAGTLEGRPVIEVLVDDDADAVRGRIPSQLDGYPLHVRRTGRIEAVDAGADSS